MSDDNRAGGGPPGDASIASSYLDRCGVICRIETARDGRVTSLNEAARLLLGARPGSCAGQALSDFLTAPDAARFAELLARAPAEEEIILNLGAPSAVPRTLRCRAYILPDRCLVLGHESHDTSKRLERTLIEVNNGLAVALREQQKSRPSLPSHGYCPDCFARITRGQGPA
jgi:PAS domain-containing protein